MPLLIKLQPALCSSLNLCNLIEIELWKRKKSAYCPGTKQKPPHPLASVCETHWLYDGAKAVDAESDKNVIRCIDNETLKEFNEFACEVARKPADRDSPYDINENVYDSDADVCGGEKRGLEIFS